MAVATRLRALQVSSPFVIAIGGVLLELFGDNLNLPAWLEGSASTIGVVAVAVVAGGALVELVVQWRSRTLTTGSLPPGKLPQRLLAAVRQSAAASTGSLQLPDGLAFRHRLKPRSNAAARQLASAPHGTRQVRTVSLDDALVQSQSRLLLLGEPGAGKSRALNRLVEKMAANWEEKPSEIPFPLYLNVRTWANFQGSLVDWILDHVCDPEYGFGMGSRDDVEDLVGPSAHVGYLFDGLEQLDRASLVALIEELNGLMTSGRTRTSNPIVVSCRTDTYHVLNLDQVSLRLRGEYEVLPLNKAQVKRAIEALSYEDPSWGAVANQIGGPDGRLLRRAMKSPFMLALLAKSNIDPKRLLTCEDQQAIEDAIVSKYLGDALGEANARGLDAVDCLSWLTWVESQLSNRHTDGDIFRIERITNGDRKQVLSWTRAVILAAATIAALPNLLGGILAFAFCAWRPPINCLPTHARPKFPRLRNSIRVVGQTVILGATLTLIQDVVLGAIGAALFAIAEVLHSNERTPPDSGLRKWRDPLWTSLIMWLSGAAVIALTLTFGMWLFAPTAVVLSLGALLGAVGGLVLTVDNGGGFVCLHAVDRMRLRRAGVLPGNLSALLNWATEKGILRPAGYGHRFAYEQMRRVVRQSSAPIL